MSVECRFYIGLTLEIKRDLTAADFKKYHEFIEKHPALDDYEYYGTNKEGKLLLVSDGMNGDFLRLIKVDKFIDGSLGSADEFIELPATANCFDEELISKMTNIYEEYTGTQPTLDDFKYAIWSQWC
jgi:hypothetical protein